MFFFTIHHAEQIIRQNLFFIQKNINNVANGHMCVVVLQF